MLKHCVAVAGLTAALTLGLAGPALAQPNDLPSSQVANATTMCRNNDRAPARDTSTSTVYFIRNPFWEGTGPLCTHTSGRTDFTVTKNPVPPKNRVVTSFPDEFYGCIWGMCTPDANLPAKVSTLGKITTSWSTVTHQSGDWNSASETWFGTTDQHRGHADGAEMMIWLNRGGVCCALAPNAKQITIDGIKVIVQHWRAYDASWKVHWNYIQFRMVTRRDKVTNLNVTDFIRYSVSQGWIQPNWWAENTGAGFECWNGCAGLHTSSFSTQTTPAKPTPPAPARRLSAAQQRANARTALLATWTKRLDHRGTPFLRYIVGHPRHSPPLRVITARRILRARNHP